MDFTIKALFITVYFKKGLPIKTFYFKYRVQITLNTKS